MFKVNNKDTRMTPLASLTVNIGVVLVSFLLTLTTLPSFWRLCFFRTYFTHCSSVSFVNFEQVNAGWVTEMMEGIT